MPDTKQRQAIRRAFEEADRPLSPTEVVTAAQREVPRLGIATVYRTVKDLVEEGWLAAVELPGLPPRYEVAGKHHHHHFHCRGCDATFEVDGCVDELSLHLPRGFRVEDHTVVLHGRCPGCARREPSAAGRHLVGEGGRRSPPPASPGDKNVKKIQKNRRRGAALVEYGLIIAGVTLVSAAAVAIFGHKTNDLIAAVATILPGVHGDDNGTIVSGKVIETTAAGDGTAGGAAVDMSTILTNSGTSRLSTNVTGDSTSTAFETLVIEQVP